ncbi:hypothetical protein P154DRAFT_439131 [Amniculicola lignicola CBS 123094]|uniref:Uncharacterized protein n=1 Tax=Amniculicola lignicola CBS 123094 TaxID=1392246 RepID=A0A6A5W9G5_9PLEO|nr:hypothetical protein P154DRAFT_439131 [Amniculicola lignicola CBS 123094]
MPSPTATRSFIRSASRYLTEPHPFNRMPTTVKPHPWRAMDLAKHVGRGAIIFPGFVGVVLWPLAAKEALDGTM